MFWSVGCSLLRAEGFSCSLCVLYGGLRISKLQFSIQKIFKKGLQLQIFFNFLSSNPWIRRSAIKKNAGSGSALNQCGSTILDDLQFEQIPMLLLCFAVTRFFRRYNCNIEIILETDTAIFHYKTFVTIAQFQLAKIITSALEEKFCATFFAPKFHNVLAETRQ